MKKQATNVNRLCLEGNGGGDYLTMEVLPDGRVSLEVGHCCVVMINHIVPVEFITAALSRAVEDNGPKEMLEQIGWSKDFTDKLTAQVERR